MREAGMQKRCQPLSLYQFGTRPTTSGEHLFVNTRLARAYSCKITPTVNSLSLNVPPPKLESRCSNA